jgi:potassium-transporting ATPase ATP-binding subunit
MTAAMRQEQPATSGGRERGPFRARFDSTGAVLLLAVRKSDPRTLWRNPVLFLVLIGAIFTTLVAITDLFSGGAAPSGGSDFPPRFDLALAFWLWATLLTANIAEALAEGRGRSETAALRARRGGTTAHRVRSYDPAVDPGALEAQVEDVDSSELSPGDIVVVAADEIVPTDGEVVWGSASLDESETTGVADPVIRSTGGDRSSVTGATTVLTDRIVVRVTARQGATVVDTMIDLAEGRVRQKSPTELALFALLASFTLSFVLIALTLNVVATTVAPAVTLPVLITIVVCLIPAEIAALLSVTGLAGMYQLLERNVLVDSSHALDTAGAITTVVLDKTGTITEGERQAAEFVTMASGTQAELIRAAALASLDDPSPEGLSTVALAASLGQDDVDVPGRVPVPFSAQTRISGCDLPDGTQVRKGGETAILEWIAPPDRALPQSVIDLLRSRTGSIARAGGTPMVVAVKPAQGSPRLLGVVDCRDVIRSSVRARIGRIRAHGIRVLMVTGDNATTADAIAKEIGVTACRGDASATDKLELVRKAQADGHLVAMGGDGTNDAAALAQADIGVAMNTSTAAAKEAANMIILDDDPTKILDIVEIGRRQMATRGALVTFNLANDLVRYFTLFPALFVGAFPGLDALNVLRLHSPASAILSTVIFGVVVIGILIPLALAGVPYRTVDLSHALGRNLLFYGVGGIVVAAAAIKLIDLIVSLFPGY